MALKLHTEPLYTLSCCRCDYVADEDGDGVMLFDDEAEAQQWANGFGWDTAQDENGLTFTCAGCKEEDDIAAGKLAVHYITPLDMP